MPHRQRARIHHSQRHSIALPQGWRPGVPRRFHRTMPGYSETPLARLDEKAQELGIGALWVKDESSRFGLPSFKILGGAWAVHRLVMARLGFDPSAADFDDLLAAASNLKVTLCTATDGNHGRGVARMAQLLGFEAVVYVPRGTAASRISGIRAEGAAVEVIAGDYDDAVAMAAAQADRNGWEVVADVAYDGYTQVPEWVMDGYDTILEECDAQCPSPPNLTFVQAGVGALAGAVLRHHLPRADKMRFGIVEPLTAACLLESATHDYPTTLKSSEGSSMAGLNCGTPSVIAWPWVRSLADVFLAIPDERVYEAMHLLAQADIIAGESGAAGLAGLLEAVEHPDIRDALSLGPDARVLVINTEGATDPAHYREIVGKRGSITQLETVR